MKFKEAMEWTCRELGYSGHLEEIKYQKDAHTYAEKIATTYIDKPFYVKNSYMYLDSVDFCFYQHGEHVDFAISGHISSGRDRREISNAIASALEICSVCEEKMKEPE